MLPQSHNPHPPNGGFFLLCNLSSFMESLTKTNGTRYVDNTVVFGIVPALAATVIAGPFGLLVYGGAIAGAGIGELIDRKYHPTPR